jgi:hypothetical protein
MAATLASPPETPRQSEPLPNWQGPAHRDPKLLRGTIAAAVRPLRGVEPRREMTLLEREARWACEWWPPD